MMSVYTCPDTVCVNRDRPSQSLWTQSSGSSDSDSRSYNDNDSDGLAGISGLCHLTCQTVKLSLWPPPEAWCLTTHRMTNFRKLDRKQNSWMLKSTKIMASTSLFTIFLIKASLSQVTFADNNFLTGMKRENICLFSFDTYLVPEMPIKRLFDIFVSRIQWYCGCNWWGRWL